MMQKKMYKILQEPLVQFFIAGGVLFILIGFFSPARSNQDISGDLVVDQGVLENYLQFQSKAFNAKAARSYLKTMDKKARDKLAADYIRDEVRYREAIALGLDKNDEVIKRRLIQKLDFVTTGFEAETKAISEDELQAHFLEHKDDYEVDASITFSHVFFDGRKNGISQATALAEKTLGRLNESGVKFEQAPGFGDRFHFNRNYIDRTFEYIKNHFGSQMAEQIFKVPPSSNRWEGPYISPYGAHLVMVIKNIPSRKPELKEVSGLVLNDVQRKKTNDARRAAVDKLINKYNIRFELENDAENK